MNEPPAAARRSQLRYSADPEIRTGVVWLARIGLTAKGLVYILIGLLAIQIPLGMGGSTEGPTDIFRRVARQPFGTVLLTALGAGMLCYALWRFAQAFLDTEHVERHGRSQWRRVGYAISGLLYGGLAVGAFRLVFWGDSSRGSARAWTARALDLPGGGILVGAAGLVTIGAGVYLWWRIRTSRLREDLDGCALTEGSRRGALWLGRLGYAAFGTGIGLIGVFLVHAALERDPGEVGGMREALESLAGAPMGPWVLGAMALGLAAFGAFMLVQASCRV
jgi:hypothetical protein